MQSYALKGGLDLRTGKAQVNPGTLQDCLNYEVSDVDGYSRITGFERFDGKFRVADFRSVRLRGTLLSGSFVPGDQIELGGASGFVMMVNAGSPWSVSVLCHSRDPWPPSLPGTLTNLSRTGSADVSAADLLPSLVGYQRDINAARKQLADAARPLVGLVPGNPDTPVAGMFWFKNRLYAIRDYPLVWFESQKQFPFHVGDQVTMPGGVYTAISVHYTSDAYLAGYMVLWPLDQAGLPMTTAPEPGDQMTRPGSYTGFDMGGAAIGELPVALMGSLDYGDGKATVTSPGQGVLPDSDDLTVRAYRTPAGLWKATASGWQPVDLKREAQFAGGTAAFGTFITNNIGLGAAPLTTGAKAGAKSVLNGIDVTAAVSADDATEAALTGQPSDELRVTGMDYSAIPDTATILGIEVRVKRHADVGGKAQDDIVELIGLDGMSSNKARAIAWDTTATEVVYGSSVDTWGNDNITPAAVKASAFGCRLVTKAIDATPSGGVGSVSVTVYYRRRDAAVYAWTGASDIALNLVDVQLVSGSYAGGDAAGWLVIDIPGAGFGQVISNGMQLRTAPAGAGDLLCTVTSGDQPIRLPGWPDLQANQSQYRFIATNYYGMADYQSVYGVSGASPAFTFDGSRLLWIRTPVDPRQDLPRHIARHGAALVLGYYPGAYILSVVGQPTNFRGEDGAVSIEIGERLTNLLPAMGDALLVTGIKQTKVLHGLDPATYQQDTLSDERGAMEYTGADVGRLLITDALGVAAADATQAFGDLTRNYLSMAVQPWLAPRLRSTLGAASNLQQAITAQAVRYKNQYRLYFRDGYCLTMTANDPPEFTLQRYGDDDAPFTMASITTGIDIDGRERVFGSFDADANRGYVFELDHGNTFDGQPIAAFATLNPLNFSDSELLKRFDRLFVLGRAEGYAGLRLSRAADYAEPDSSKSFAFTLGSRTATAPKTGSVAARGGVDAPIEGYEVTVRIDATTDTEGAHTLQAIATDADPRGDSRGHVRG